MTKALNLTVLRLADATLMAAKLNLLPPVISEELREYAHAVRQAAERERDEMVLTIEQLVAWNRDINEKLDRIVIPASVSPETGGGFGQ